MPDIILCNEAISTEATPTAHVAIPAEIGAAQGLALFNIGNIDSYSKGIALLELTHAELTKTFINTLREKRELVLVLNAISQNPVAEFRSMVFRLREAGANNPVILKSTSLS